ncbi:MAG: response regulator [Burkholderiales bacterium]|nr:response regulator [Burkholderiales bacterium]
MSDGDNQNRAGARAVEEMTVSERRLATVRLAGFSDRDRELLRLFLRRPPGAGVSLSLVDDETADLVIANTQQAEGVFALRNLSDRANAPAAIGIVERFERDAPYYQVAQDSQMLFSLAQGINRIRNGWVPPVTGKPSGVRDPLDQRVTGRGGSPEIDAASASSALRSPVVPTGAAPTSTDLPWQRGLHVLVIDDSHFSREAVASALVKIGFHVQTAESGEEGLKLASKRHYDVALVDFEMPGMKGPEALRRLRALNEQAPSVLMMLTSRSGAVDRLRAKFAGCDAYLTKPTRMNEFLKKLREFAAEGRLSRS